MVFPLFTIWRIPVFAQPWALAVPLYCLYIFDWNPLTGLAAAAGVLLSVWIHEMGHALMAARWNLRPQVVLGAIGGFCQHDRAETDGQDAAIIAAGPGIQILAGVLLAAIWAGLGAAAPDIAMHPVLYAFGSAFLLVSILWGAINLLPIWHLDGGRLYRLGLIHILKLKPGPADKTTHITAIVIGALLALGFLAIREPFAVLLIGFLVFQNIQRLRAGTAAGPVRKTNSHAKDLLKQARKALDNGEYREAARLGHQIRAQPDVPDRILAPTWEIIAVGSIQSGRVEDGLRFARRAPQTPRVVAARVQGLLELGKVDEAEELLRSREFANMPATLQDALETEVAKKRPN